MTAALRIELNDKDLLSITMMELAPIKEQSVMERLQDRILHRECGGVIWWLVLF